MNYEVKEQLYEGKAKQVFATNDPEIVMVHYKDDATEMCIRDRASGESSVSGAMWYMARRVSSSGRPMAAPAGETCLKLAAAGRPSAFFKSRTSCQELNASRKLM